MRSLWLHGWASDSRVFGPLIAELPQSMAAQAAIPNIPGYSPGNKATDPISSSTWLEQKVADASVRGPVIFGGWSLGAILALEAAAARPKSVSALVLISGCARFTRASDNPHGQDPRVVRAMQLGLRRNSAKVVADFIGEIFAPEEQASAEKFQLICGQYFPKINPIALADGLNYLLTTNLTVPLERIACPVLMIHGSADSVIDLRLARELADSLPDARLVVLDGAGHTPLWSQSRECARHIVEFIESCG